MMTAEYIIEQLKMQPLPVEGGFFAVTHIAPEQLEKPCLPPRYATGRPFYSSIYYLVTTAEFSAIHKLPTDELYYYHYGDPMELLVLAPDGTGTRKLLGTAISQGQVPQLLVPKHCWQGSRSLPGNSQGFSLVSTTMAPSYVESDPVFAEREELSTQYPEFADLITSLTRK